MANVLQNTSLSQIRSLQQVIILKDSATVEQVLRTLATHKLVAAPVVVDGAVEGSRHGPMWPMSMAPQQVAGFIDVKSIIRKFLEELKGTGILETKSMLRRMRSLEQKGLTFSKSTIKDHDLLSGDGSFLNVENDDLPLMELAKEAMLGNSKRASSSPELPDIVHRIAIFDSASRLVNVISQSDIVRYLYDHAEQLGDIKDKTVAEVGFTPKTIVSVEPEISAIDALQVLNEKRIGAVAVVNRNGKLIGNFSAADMRTITPEHFGSLALPVGEFLALEHGVEYAGYAINRSSSDFTSSSGEKPVAQLNRLRSSDFLEQKQPLGSDGQQATLQFARTTAARRPDVPGSDVGQNLIVCTMGTALLEVPPFRIDCIVHRVFIVDEEIKPIGVITCTDILRKLVDLFS